ncbi:MAG: glycoside hydrolase family 3 [Ruminococcus sp.]|nr:glycoside hydrolase family 3 [Ruminococcus sp.]
MKVKKLMAMALSMSLALCACAEKTKTPEETSEEPTTEPVTETTEPVTEPPAPEKTVPEKVLERMSLHDKVCQMFITTPEQLSGYDIVTLYDDIVADSIASYNIGGLIMFTENLETTEQTSQMISDIQECALATSGIGMFMSVDEEGGTVARVADTLGTTAFSDMAVYGEQNDSHVSYEIGYQIGTDLKALGFNLDFAPVADVNTVDENTGYYSELGDRIFSSDPDIVADMASNVAVGLKDAGVCATMKHFPGLGGSVGDTHLDANVTINRSVDDLRNTEFLPFRAGITAGVDFIMVGHQVISGIGDWLPSDLSYTVVTELLRNELGFEGIIITDSQMMSTISEVYTSAEAAVMAVNAGVDVILMPTDLVSAIDAVCQAVENGEISSERIDESVLRILNKKHEMGLLDVNFVPTAEEEPTTEETTEETTETTTEETTESTTEEVTEEETVTEETTTEIMLTDVGGNPIKTTTTFAGYVAGSFVDPNRITTTTTTTAEYYEDYNYDYDYNYNYDYSYDYDYDYNDGYYDYGYDGYYDDYYEY